MVFHITSLFGAVSIEFLALPYKQKSFDEWATFEKADPWLIAIAKAHDYTIVTMEERNRNLNPSNPTSKEPRIPDVCDALGVNCINLYDLMHGKKCVI